MTARPFAELVDAGKLLPAGRCKGTAGKFRHLSGEAEGLSLVQGVRHLQPCQVRLHGAGHAGRDVGEGAAPLEEELDRLLIGAVEDDAHAGSHLHGLLGQRQGREGFVVRALEGQGASLRQIERGSQGAIDPRPEQAGAYGQARRAGRAGSGL